MITPVCTNLGRQFGWRMVALSIGRSPGKPQRRSLAPRAKVPFIGEQPSVGHVFRGPGRSLVRIVSLRFVQFASLILIVGKLCRLPAGPQSPAGSQSTGTTRADPPSCPSRNKPNRDNRNGRVPLTRRDQSSARLFPDCRVDEPGSSRMCRLPATRVGSRDRTRPQQTPPRRCRPACAICQPEIALSPADCQPAPPARPI
jgi:hypothetical protein